MKLSEILALMLVISGCTTTISGEITDSNGQPISFSGKINIVRLDSNAEQKSLIIDIDQRGMFESNADLEEGEYLVEPLIPGYEYGSTRISLTSSQHLKFAVKERPKTKPKTFKANDNLNIGMGAGNANLTPPKY